MSFPFSFSLLVLASSLSGPSLSGGDFYSFGCSSNDKDFKNNGSSSFLDVSSHRNSNLWIFILRIPYIPKSLGTNNAKAGQYVTMASNTKSAKRNGQTSFTIASTFSPVTDDSVNKDRPTGGVMSDMFKARMKMMPA